jgi:SAM-dependent methyltransferase
VARDHHPLTHAQRARAESFGQVAAQYDRFRPSYPSALVDDLLAGGARRLLDLGCGTGKAGRLFAARGVDVLGVEIDPAMAELARSHGLTVEVAAFEEWDDAGRTFDLVISGQAWHWLDPDVAAPKVARLLTPGGELAVFWNFEELAPEEQAIVEAVYRDVAPELVAAPGAGTDDTHRRRLEDSGQFATVDAVTYPAERDWPVEEWVGNISTHSNLLLLGDRLPVVLDRLRAALSERGPVVRTRGGTYVIRARP